MRLTRQQFRAVAKARGYTLAEVAVAWGVSRPRLSQIAADAKRKPMYEFALWGLPPRGAAAAIAERRLTAARALSGPAQRERPKAADPWMALIEPGAIFIVTAEQGEHLREGCAGTVIAQETRQNELHVLIKFEGGYSEAFSLAWLKSPGCFLVATGRAIHF